MKRLTLLLALFCSALIAVVSCDKPGSDERSPKDGPTGIPEEYGDFELAEGAVFMTEDMTSMFSSVEDGRILISSSVPQSSVPAEGTIIIAPITEKTPSGLLVKIVSVQETATGYVLTTEPVSLFDAFEELKVDAAPLTLSPSLMISGTSSSKKTVRRRNPGQLSPCLRQSSGYLSNQQDSSDSCTRRSS